MKEYEYQATSECHLTQPQLKQCIHSLLIQVNGQNTNNQNIKGRSTHEGNMHIRPPQREVLVNTSKQYMKAWRTHAGNVIARPLQRVVLLNTSMQYMKGM